MRRLKGGADFAALAKAESDDPGSKANGGDLGSFPRGRMVKEFEEAAFSAKEKEIVGPVKSSFGYHVIQVLERTGERVQPLFEVSAGIRARLQEDRARDEAKRLAAGLAEKVAKMGKPSDDDLRKLAGGGVTFNETEFLARTDAPAGIGFNPQFSEKLFSLKEGEAAATPVSTARGEAIVKLVEIKKPGLPAFAEVKARVVADIQKKRQDEATLASLKQAMTADATLEGDREEAEPQDRDARRVREGRPDSRARRAESRSRRRVRREAGRAEGPHRRGGARSGRRARRQRDAVRDGGVREGEGRAEGEPARPEIEPPPAGARPEETLRPEDRVQPRAPLADGRLEGVGTTARR